MISESATINTSSNLSHPNRFVFIKNRIFVATDEHNSTNLAYLSSHNAVLLSDLLTPSDRRIVGWPLLISDVQAQVEQIIASHGSFFWGFKMSSVTGGIVNLRGARGLDRRTNWIEGA